MSKQYKSINDLPDWVKMITGGIAGSVAEAITIPIDTAVCYLLIFKNRRYVFKSKNQMQMENIDIMDY